MNRQEYLNKVQTEAKKRRAKLLKEFEKSKLSEAEFARKNGFSRQWLNIQLIKARSD